MVRIYYHLVWQLRSWGRSCHAQRREHQIYQPSNCRRILASRRDLEPVVFSMLFERSPKLSKEEILMIAGLPLQELRHTRAVQEILEEGRQEGREEGLEAGRQQEAFALAIRQLSRRCGSLDEGSRERLSSPDPAAAGATGGRPARFLRD